MEGSLLLRVIGRIRSRNHKHSIHVVMIVVVIASIAVAVLIMVQSESSLLQRISSSSSLKSLTSLKTIEATNDEAAAAIAAYETTIPSIIECTDGCLYFGYPPGCYHSNGVPLRGSNRWMDEWKHVTNPNILSKLSIVSAVDNNNNSSSNSNEEMSINDILDKMDDDRNTTTTSTTAATDRRRRYTFRNSNTTTIVNDNNHNGKNYNNYSNSSSSTTSAAVLVLYIHTPERNINHIFHDDFWSLLSYFSHPQTLQYLNDPKQQHQQNHHSDHYHPTDSNHHAVINVTLVHDYTSLWLIELVNVIATAYPWWNIIHQLQPTHHQWVCTATATVVADDVDVVNDTDTVAGGNDENESNGNTTVNNDNHQPLQSQSLPKQKLYVSGFIRNMYDYQVSHLPRIRKELRTVTYAEVTKRNLWTVWDTYTSNSNTTAGTSHSNTTATTDAKSNISTTKRERIVIYTREDSGTRQIHNVAAIIAELDTERYDIHVQRRMPTDFYEQVAMFAMADLLIAPNGGWTPNVLWMKDTACLVEIHLYDHNSWLLKYGLSTLFNATLDLVKTVTGDYHNETINGPRIQNPGRHGGDDEIQGSMVISDIVSKLRESQFCQRFLFCKMNPTGV